MKYRTKIRVIGFGDSYYHVMSRITERRFYLGSTEKEHFRNMMRRVAEFSGVKILTYAVLDNHFHLLIQVPKRCTISDDELFRRMRRIYPEAFVRAFITELADTQAVGDECRTYKKLRNRYIYRMYNLSEFMKTLKQRFAIWYNATHARQGHLWDDRFKSVLVQGPGTLKRPGALWVMAQYIELNAVRANVVADAAAYHWCGFAEAVSGSTHARQGIMMLFQGPIRWETACSYYQHQLNIRRGQQPVTDDKAGLQSLKYFRVRYFVDGVILGSSAFVESMFHKRRHLFCESRKTGARKMRGGDWEGLCTIRDFKKHVLRHVS